MLGFRVWDNLDKKMIDLSLRQKVFDDMESVTESPFCLNFNGQLSYVSAAYYLGNIEIANLERYIPMQSTGQMDADGKMIYEGDVISTFQSMFIYVDSVRNFYITCLTHKLSGFKVVGNVYENPGLEFWGK